MKTTAYTILYLLCWFTQFINVWQISLRRPQQILVNLARAAQTANVKKWMAKPYAPACRNFSEALQAADRNVL